MANRTDPAAKSVHGTNPQNLVEKIVREKIYQNAFWKEQCFALTAETLVDKAMELNHIGGTYGGNLKPTPFMCLTLKMLQIQPEKEIVVEFIKNGEYKYVRALGAFYMRLVGKPTDVYQYLEPLYNDYRKMRQRVKDGSFVVVHVDEFIDELLTTDYALDIALPRVPKRSILEQNNQLEPRKSALEDDFEEEEEKEAEEEAAAAAAAEAEKERKREKAKERQRDQRDRDREERDRDRDRHRERRDRDRDYDRSRDLDRDRDRDRDYYRRDRDRDYERDSRSNHRYRRRSRSRSRDRRNRDRDDRRRSPSPARRRDDGPMEEGEHRPATKDEKPKKKEEKPNKKAKKEGSGTSNKKKPDENDPEIIEMNKLRASLGLPPLK